MKNCGEGDNCLRQDAEQKREIRQMGTHKSENGRRKAEQKKDLIICVILLIIATVALVFFVAAKATSNRQVTEADDTESSVEEASSETTAAEEEETEEESEEETTAELTGSEDLVIFGVDTRSTNLSSGTRSDSIMIVHVDHDTQTVKVCSIYRDTMVSIEGYGYEKITHAHSYGGPELALDTINTNFDLAIEKYVTVNFINVADLIDDLGGVEQEITSAEAEVINSYISEINSIRGTDSAYITEAGTYVLDGTQAVAFSRIRYTSGGDYKRTERQRTILFKVFEAAKELDSASRLALAAEMLDSVNTNYDISEVYDLLICLSDYEITDMGAYPEVFYGGTVDGAWVEVPVTLIDMNASIHEFLYGETDYEPSATVTSISATLSSKASTANNDMRDEEEDEDDENDES